jgi:hypothetical protein
MRLGNAILGVSTLVFTAYGLVSLADPAIPSGFSGLEMSNGDAFAEIGAMYGGLQTGVGLFCLLALMKPDFYRAGLALLATAIGAMAVARLFSFGITTEAVSAYTYGALLYEFLTAILAGIALMKKSNDPA